jgi:hypothetical protein
LLLLLSAVLIGSLAGCGDDGGSADSGSTETTAADSKGSGDADADEVDALVATLSGPDGPGVPEADARCVAEAVLPEMSAESKKSLDDGDLDELSADEQDVVVAAFNDCVETADIAAALAEEISSGDDALSPETAECISAAVVDEYPKSGDLMRLMTSDEGEAAMTALVTACIPQDDIQQALVDQFVASGFSDDQAQCIATALSGRISTEQLVDAADGTLAPEVEQAVTEATLGCVPGG